MVIYQGLRSSKARIILYYFCAFGSLGGNFSSFLLLLELDCPHATIRILSSIANSTQIFVKFTFFLRRLEIGPLVKLATLTFLKLDNHLPNFHGGFVGMNKTFSIVIAQAQRAYILPFFRRITIFICNVEAVHIIDL